MEFLHVDIHAETPRFCQMMQSFDPYISYLS